MTGMSFGSFTPDQFIKELEEATTVTRRESKKVLRAGGQDILQTSQDYAPIDDGELVKAHSLEVVTLNIDHMEIEISVGGVIDGVDVDNYAMEVHETMQPFGTGTMRRGPGTLAKDAGRNVVGGKFLERAFDLHDDRIGDLISDTLLGS